MEGNENQDTGGALVPSRNQVARRDFGGVALSTENAATQALVAKQRADIEARWIVAMRSPRNIDDVRQELLRECSRPGFADVAVYARPVGNTKNEKTGTWEPAFAEGLSIRFAEAALRHMGNMSCETETIYDGEIDRVVRVTITDYETNAMWRRDITVKKTIERRQLKKGQRALGQRVNSYGDVVFIVEATDDEVATKEAALISKAARTGILRVIPGNIQDEAFAKCKKLNADKSAKDPDAERVRMLDAFASMNVLPSDLEELLGHPTTQMAPAEIDKLRKIYAALSTGEITWPEALEMKAKPAAAVPAPGQPTANTNAAPPAQAPAPAAPKKSRGAAALKDSLKTDTPAPSSEPTAFDKAAADARAKDAARDQAKTDPEAEPGWMAGKDAPAPDGATEERACASCGVPIEVPKNAAVGAKCYACTQS